MASIQPAPTIAAKVTAFLASPKDWDNWFAVTKSYATLQKVWHLVDPELDVENHANQNPSVPVDNRSALIKPTALTLL